MCDLKIFTYYLPLIIVVFYGGNAQSTPSASTQESIIVWGAGEEGVAILKQLKQHQIVTTNIL